MNARLHVFAVLSLVVAAMLHASSAQTTHVVGNDLGWQVPPGGEAVYRTWAAARNFSVGDVLVFNFTTNSHTVAEVSRQSFDSCNTTNPISLSRTGPTNITLSSAGEHHFICTFSGHCGFGQKLAINVSASAATPAPQPAAAPPQTAPSPAMPTTPPPVVAPAPSPSRVGMTYTVGDRLGWTVPPGGPPTYQTWARGKRFMVGDILLFNFTNGEHSVIQVTRAEFDSCNVSTTTTPPTTASPARIPLTSGGEHYYICTFPRHCSFGQKLAINVTAAGSTAPPPSSSANGPSGSGGPTANTPSTLSPPPPGNSAPSVIVSALPFTFFTLALAFMYN